MLTWITGTELLERPYSLLKSDLFAHIEAGRLVPYEAYQGGIYEVEDYPGAKRILPSSHLAKLDGSLRGKRYHVEWQESALAKSDEELRADYDKNSAALARIEPESRYLWEEPSIKREEWKQQLEKFGLEIAALKAELDPAKVWKNLNVSPERQAELETRLLDAWYLRAEVEMVSPAFDQQGDNPAPETKRNRQDQKDRMAVVAWAKQKIEQLLRATLVELAELAKDELEEAKAYSDRTLIEWIRPVRPQYTPGKPGAKEKTHSN